MPKNLLEALLALPAFPIKDDLAASKKPRTTKEFGIERSNTAGRGAPYTHARNYQGISKKAECGAFTPDQAGRGAPNQALQYKKAGHGASHI